MDRRANRQVRLRSHRTRRVPGRSHLRTDTHQAGQQEAGLLILDEVFDSSLDVTGTEELMKILHALDDVNLFVISHKGDILQDKFANTIRFDKVKNFSRIIT